MNSSMEQRLTRLERSNHRGRTCCLGLVLVVTAGVLVSAGKAPVPEQIIQARRFELIGPDGKATLIMEAKPDATSLAVYGPDHRHVAILVAKQNTAAMVLLKDPQAVEVSAEAADPGGQIVIGDGRSTGEAGERSSLNLTGSNDRFSIFHMVNGRPASQLSFSKLGGGLELRTPGSKAATRILGSDKGGHVEILNADGLSVWSAPPSK